MQGQTEEIGSGVYHWLELPVRLTKERESRKIMEGSSPHFEYLEMHATTQIKGAVPSPPHAQTDIEEIIIVKEGTMKFTMDGEDAMLGPGSVILIPPLAMQSLQNVGDGPLTYYVMMFRSKKPMDLVRGEAAGGHLLLNADSLTFQSTARGGRISYFDRPTANTENFEMHVTQLNQKGPSHEPHTHLDSEMILVIDGDTEMTIAGKEYQATAGDLYFIKSNDQHGIRNASDKPCKYFAFRWR
jgi:quercetin dioxygenase-like cupin family protein